MAGNCLNRGQQTRDLCVHLSVPSTAYRFVEVPWHFPADRLAWMHWATTSMPSIQLHGLLGNLGLAAIAQSISCMPLAWGKGVSEHWLQPAVSWPSGNEGWRLCFQTGNVAVTEWGNSRSCFTFLLIESRVQFEEKGRCILFHHH